VGAPPQGQTSRGDATRDRLLEVAAKFFGERGYEATSIEAVLREAGVSRGSLYHHFASKGALFAAVVEAVETRVGAQIAEAGAAAVGPHQILRAGAREWVRLAGDPLVQRVLLIDAPAVLGWEQWRELEERHALGLVKAVLELAAADRLIRPEMVDVMAHVLLAAVNEIALYVARSPDPTAAMRSGTDAIDDLLGGLFGP
jgi:AcrR family transcriptional regulator